MTDTPSFQSQLCFFTLKLTLKTKITAAPCSSLRLRPTLSSLFPSFHPQVDPDLTSAKFDQELFQDWCSSTYTHHVGTINWLEDGSMIYGAGDGSHFQVSQSG